MNKKNLTLSLTCGALILLALGLFLKRSPSRHDNTGPTAVTDAQNVSRPSAPAADPAPNRILKSEGGRSAFDTRVRAPGAEAPRVVAAPVNTGSAQPPSDARIQVVTDWEKLVDTLSEQTVKPTASDAIAFKDAFHKLDPDDQMDGIRTALNLLPDEQFPLLYPILFDKLEKRDLLDEIFSDALNRDEDIKVPIMKEIIKDKEHPMYADAMHILEVTGELEDEASKTATPVEGNIE